MPATQTTLTDREAAEQERAQRHNAKLAEALREAKQGRGYVATSQGGEKIHAATGAIQGWGGYNHPRSFCQPHTPRSYASLTTDTHTREVTCQRCLASLVKKGLI